MLNKLLHKLQEHGVRWPQHLESGRAWGRLHKGWGLSQSFSPKELCLVHPNADVVLRKPNVSNCMLVGTSTGVWSHSPRGRMES